MAVESDHEEINLNEDQKVVVYDEDYKFLSVQAGPGSGKTRVLVEKVKYMVNVLDVKPETFLIITFTDNAAEELRDRLIEGEIPASDVQKMQISTIHSFCLKVLEEAGEVGLDVVAEGDKLHLFIKKHLDKLGFEDDLNIGNGDIANMIEKYKEYSTFQVDTEGLVEYLEENFDIHKDFFNFVHEYMEKNDGEFPVDEVDSKKAFRESYKNAKYIQIAKSYPKYLKLLKEKHAIDFNQMQFQANDKLTEEFLNRVFPKYTNVLIDEFQDTDPVQMEIFKKFIDNPNTNSVTVVGDINQSIYGFRGSNKNYFKELSDLYPGKFEPVFLSTNYRSTEEIIDLTQDFISPHYKPPHKLTRAKCGRKEMEDRPEHNDVYFMVSENGETEADNIIKIIRYIMADKKMNLSDIAILSRSVKPNQTSCFKPLTKKLEENNINYQVRGIGDLAEIEEIKYILTLMYHLIQDDDPYYTFVPSETAKWLNLKTLTGANENKVLFELSDETKKILNQLHDRFEQDVIDKDGEIYQDYNPRGSPIDEFSKIFGRKRKRKDAVFAGVKKPILSDENLIEYGITNERDLEFFHALNDLKRKVNAEHYSDRPTISDVYLELLCDITGYLTVDLVNNEEEISNNLAAIVSPISVYSEMMYERGLRGGFWSIMRSIKSIDAFKPDEDAVQIMTVHKSKGKEFPVVILASLRDSKGRDKGFPFKYKEDNEKSVTYTPDAFLKYPRYEDDAKESFIQEEERVIYVGKTRAEDELILSSIVGESAEAVKMALMRDSPENIKSIDKGPKRVNDVIGDNLDYCKLINPEEININLLDPEHNIPKEEIVQLSFTALENYKECPFKYKLANQLGFSFSSKKAIDDGIFIHSALEIINKKIKAKCHEENIERYELPSEEISEIVEQLFEKANQEFKEEDPKNYSDKLEYITNDVIRYYNEIGNDLIIKDSEYSFYIREENYAFSGKVDLIYEKDGKLGILDYKNTSLVSEEYLEKYKKQLHYYVMALRDEDGKFEGQEIEEIQIYAIKYGTKDAKGKLFSFKINEDYIEELKGELEKTAEKIKENKFEPSCEDCGDCQFKKICKK